MPGAAAIFGMVFSTLSLLATRSSIHMIPLDLVILLGLLVPPRARHEAGVARTGMPRGGLGS
jgi:hypothetical protein